MTLSTISTAYEADAENWRLTHLGRRLGHALRRFDARVLSRWHAYLRRRWRLSNLAARDQVGAAHIRRQGHPRWAVVDRIAVSGRR